jgi:DNA polymerase-1
MGAHEIRFGALADDDVAKRMQPMAEVKPRLFLIDGHSQLYRAYHAMGPLATRDGEPTGAIFGFLQVFHRLRKTHGMSHVVVVFDPPGPTFRSEDFEDYKANRPEQPPELTRQFEVLRELLDLMRLPVILVPGFEADDIIATLARWAVENGGEACIVSVDKDLLQCVEPGVTVLRDHLGKIELLDEAGVKEKLGVTAQQVPAYLGLLGDTADNIPGVPGIGKKRAMDLLNEFGDMESLLAAAVGREKPKFWAALAENADLARRSMQLATVRRDVPLEASWQAFRWEYLPDTKLRDMLKRLEFRSLVEEIGGQSLEDRTVDYATVRTRAELERAVAAILKAGEAAIDTETTGLDPHTDRLVGLSLSWAQNQAVYVPIRGDDRDDCLEQQEVVEIMAPLFRKGAVKWIAHNWRFDYKVLRAAGFDAEECAVDTMIAAYLINPDRATNSLKGLGRECLGIEMTPIKELIGSGDDLVTMAGVDVEKVSEYACQDADVTRQLRDHLLPQLGEGTRLRKLFDGVEVPLTTVLARMEWEGVRIDVDYFRRLRSETMARLASLTSQIYGHAGREFNINSTKQLAQVLFEDLGLPSQKKTTTGFSTDVTVLEELAKLHPLPACLLEYRQLEKLRGTYIEALPMLVNRKTGRLHSSFNQTVAATGRLSSSDPNLQNIPVRTEDGRKIRRGFVPREKGWRLIGADYSQIELRILAHMADDEALIAAFRHGDDIHALTASKVYGVDLADVTKEMRSAAKAINFGIIYGMTAFRLARDLGISRKTAEQFIADYFKAYSGVRAFIDKTLEECRENGYVETMLGRRRYVPDIKASNPNARNAAERIAMNTPIQGTSADMIKLAMLRIDKRIREEGLRARMILQVHDELIFDAPEDEVDRVRALAVEEMQAALPLKVPIDVDVQDGENWEEI